MEDPFSVASRRVKEWEKDNPSPRSIEYAKRRAEGRSEIECDIIVDEYSPENMEWIARKMQLLGKYYREEFDRQVWDKMMAINLSPRKRRSFYRRPPSRVLRSPA